MSPLNCHLHSKWRSTSRTRVAFNLHGGIYQSEMLCQHFSGAHFAVCQLEAHPWLSANKDVLNSTDRRTSGRQRTLDVPVTMTIAWYSKSKVIKSQWHTWVARLPPATVSTWESGCNLMDWVLGTTLWHAGSLHSVVCSRHVTETDLSDLWGRWAIMAWVREAPVFANGNRMSDIRGVLQPLPVIKSPSL